MRDRSTLTIRLNKKQRREGGETCFEVETTDTLAERLAFHLSRTPVGRTEKALARARADRADYVKRLRGKLALANAYQAETARIRAASGVEAAKQRVTKGHAPAYLIAEKIVKYPVATPEGLSAKADFLLTCDEAAHVGHLFGKGNLGMVGFGWGLAEDIKRLRGQGAVQS